MSHFDPEELKDIKPGPIAWMASHPVAANLLMLIFIFGGLIILANTTKEIFPDFSEDNIAVTMAYPGASPAEVEQGIVLAVEEAISDIEGLEEIESQANEGFARIEAEIIDPDEKIRVLQDVKTAVDQITTFPVDAEDLSVFLNNRRTEVLSLALYGDVEEGVLRAAAEQVRDTLDQDNRIGPVELTGVREYEIHIDISQENLRRYSLSLPQVAGILQDIALERGAGRLDTSGGEILVRMSERRDYAREFANIPIITRENGSQVLLGDIADIKEGFDNSVNFAFFENKPAVRLTTYRIGDQTPVGVSSAVKENLENLNATLPQGLTVKVLNDRSTIFKQRAELLMKNGLFGLMLVVILLALFLDVRLAFWVSMGIPISFMGAFLLFPTTDFTVNIISMFAFIISLGIVVDDAIVSGENIYHYRQMGYKPLRASVEGAREISIPITISVLTNIVAFVPLFFVPGPLGKAFGVIPVVVITVFFISLIESLFILPAHLTFKKADDKPKGFINRFIKSQKSFSEIFQEFVRGHYAPFLELVIRNRYLALAFFLAVLVSVGGYIGSGRVGMTLFPRVESDFSYAGASLRVGAPIADTKSAEQQLVDAAHKVVKSHGDDQLSEGVFSSINDNKIEIYTFMTEPDIRPISTNEFTKKWRENVGEIAGLETMTLQSDRGGPGSGKALTIELSHTNTEVLDKAAVELAETLESFPVARDIDDGSNEGKKQYEFKMKELGYTLGMSSQDVARQVRSSFYGAEVFKQQRGRHEVRVLVRLPDEQRSSPYYLKNLILRTPDGSEVLLRDVVDIESGRAYTTINRRNARRVIHVEADIEPPSEAGRIIAALKSDALPRLQERYPGLTYSFEGRQADIRDSMVTLFIGMFAVIFVMYALLAVLFSSYVQPLMVLIAIPFSAIGAVFGHFIMGYSLSIMSMFGLMALAGVVVNDSLILIDFANRRRQEMEMAKAIVEAGIQRFRPIILTTLTTFVGLAPMIFETSRQARFLIPMAISLGFGIIFATLLTLILIPALYVILEDIKGMFRQT